MKTVITAVFKYLSWALLILVALLYFENYQVRTQGLIILVGVIALDIVFNLAGLIGRAVDSRRKKNLAAAKAVKETGAAVKDSLRSAGDTVVTAGTSAWSAIRETGERLSASLHEKKPSDDTSALPASGNKDKK